MKRTVSAILTLTLLFASVGCSTVHFETDLVSSASAEGNSAALWLEERLNSDGVVPVGNVSVGVAQDATVCGVDMSGIADDGYIIRRNGGDTVILGKTAVGADKAVRYYANKLATTGEDVSVVEGEGYRVGQIIIGGYDVAEYTVILPADATENMKHAASELKSYIKKSCGVSMPVVTLEGAETMDSDALTAAGYPHTVMILTDPTAAGTSALEAGEMGNEDYSITVGDGRMTIVGGNMRGCMYAVYEFLEDCIGWRFLPADVEYLYENDVVRVDEMDVYDSPQFWYRCTTFAGKTETSFAKLRHNSKESWAFCEKPKYGYGNGTEFYHAHSFMYQVEGLGEYEQPCFTDPEITEEIIASMLSLLDQRSGWGKKVGYEFSMISCSANDCGNYCICQDCIAEMQNSSLTDMYLRIVNSAADVIAEKYPGMYVYGIANSLLMRPPVEEVPRDNVIIHCCIGYCAQHHQISEECNDYPVTSFGSTAVDMKEGHNGNAVEKDWVEEWAKICPNLFIWHYFSSFGTYLAPSPDLYNLYEDIRSFAEVGATGVYLEGSYTLNQNFEYLKSYLGMKMLWDPDITEEEFFGLIDEYLMIYYGSGWEYVREYLDMYEAAGDAVEGCFTNNYHLPFDMVSRSYFRQNFDYMDYLLTEAARLADSAEQEMRLVRLRAHCLFLGLSATYEEDYVNGDSDSRAVYEAKYRVLLDTVKNCDIQLCGNPAQITIPETYEITGMPVDMFLSLEGGAKEKNR